jgi:hypothetical protein
MVFAVSSGQFYRDITTPYHLTGLSHLDNFALTKELMSIYQDCAKTTPVKNSVNDKISFE